MNYVCTDKSGASVALALYHFMKQLSMCQSVEVAIYSGYHYN